MELSSQIPEKNIYLTKGNKEIYVVKNSGTVIIIFHRLWTYLTQASISMSRISFLKIIFRQLQFSGLGKFAVPFARSDIPSIFR